MNNQLSLWQPQTEALRKDYVVFMDNLEDQPEFDITVDFQDMKNGFWRYTAIGDLFYQSNIYKVFNLVQFGSNKWSELELVAPHNSFVTNDRLPKIIRDTVRRIVVQNFLNPAMKRRGEGLSSNGLYKTKVSNGLTMVEWKRDI